MLLGPSIFCYDNLLHKQLIARYLDADKEDAHKLHVRAAWANTCLQHFVILQPMERDIPIAHACPKEELYQVLHLSMLCFMGNKQVSEMVYIFHFRALNMSDRPL